MTLLVLISPRLSAAKGHVLGQVDAVSGLSLAHLGSGSRHDGLGTVHPPSGWVVSIGSPWDVDLKTSSDLDLDGVGVGLHGPRRSWTGLPQSRGAMSLRPCPKPRPPPLNDANSNTGAPTQGQGRSPARLLPRKPVSHWTPSTPEPTPEPKQSSPNLLFQDRPSHLPALHPAPSVMRPQSLWGLSPLAASRAQTHSGTRLP